MIGGTEQPNQAEVQIHQEQKSPFKQKMDMAKYCSGVFSWHVIFSGS